MTTPGLALHDERADALDHGLALIREAWQSFDAPRPTQPPVACLRPCIVNFRTTIDDVRAILDIAEELGAQLESGGLPTSDNTSPAP